MPVYEYYCRPCNSKFELLRSMKLSDQTATCPAGHKNAARTVSVFAALGVGVLDETASFAGGCACGGACSCGGH
jgi:putative FmdB family regulatory protein